MVKDEDLVPVFIPALAVLLAAAQEKLGRALSEPEVLAIRDKGVCMMMESAHSTSLENSRGFRDVDPEDTWADWHRLAVEMTGVGFLPKLVFCVLGDEEFAARASAVLRAEGVEFELSGRDERMSQAFRGCRRGVRPSELDWEAIEGHSQVIYFLSQNFGSGVALETCRRFLRLGAGLLGECGGVAMKCESSGVAHSKERWLELAAGDELVEALVQMPLGNSREMWTCGMHLLGRTDVIANRTEDVGEIASLFDVFCRYLVGECPHFASGHTFGFAADEPRWRGVWEPCQGYAEDDFFYNCFGRLRFAPVLEGKSS